MKVFVLKNVMSVTSEIVTLLMKIFLPSDNNTGKYILPSKPSYSEEEKVEKGSNDVVLLRYYKRLNIQ